MADNPHALQNLLAATLRDAADLARKEFALLKAEMAANVRTLGMAIGMMIGAAVLAILSLIWLTQALVEWLATVVHSEALAALIVGVAMAAIAAGLGLYGRSTMASASLAPTRTAQSVRRDAEVISERVSG